MGSSKVTLTTSIFYKGNYSSTREFTALQNNRNILTIWSLISILVALILYYIFKVFNSNWHPTFIVTITIVLTVFAIFFIFFSVKKETVLLVVPIVMQLTTTYLSGRQTIKSIPWYLLRDLMILDVIVGQQVLYFLAVEVGSNKSEYNRHIVLFRHTRPRLKYLERIYREFQEILDTNR